MFIEFFGAVDDGPVDTPDVGTPDDSTPQRRSLRRTPAAASSVGRKGGEDPPDVATPDLTQTPLTVSSTGSK